MTKIYNINSEGIRQYKMLINNEWVDSFSGETFSTTTPFNGEIWAEVPKGEKQDIDRAVSAAKNAFEHGPWSKMSGVQRGELLRRLGELITRNEEELAIIESTDNGKIIREMLGQLRSAPNWCNYYAGIADKIQGETIPLEYPNMFAYTIKEPIGVVGAIVPWNSPILITLMKLAPALAAGNTIVIKPSEVTPVSLLEFSKLIIEAGFPPGVVNVVTGFGATAGDALSRHPDVRKITFTGSGETGKLIAKNAAEHHARVSLELGGKSPNIIFDDANLDNAVNGVLAGIFGATGQTCIAGSRVFIQKSIYDEFSRRLVESAKKIRLGNPLEETTDMGTVAFQGQLDKILSYIDIGMNEGATLLCGGKRPLDPELQQGLFIEPTIFGNVNNKMRIAQEEIFGPVACLIPFEDENDVVNMANDNEFGLALGIWTQSIQLAHRVAAKISSGMVWINNYRKVSCAAPFGGFKSSGYGRENGWEAINDFTQVKTVWVDLGNEIPDPFRML